MEQIQSAIAKARAARERGGDVARSTPRPAIPAVSAAVAPTADTAAAAWMALDTFTPEPRLMQRNHIAAFEGGPEAVTFDVMRTKLLQQMRANNWRRLAITSPGAGCGKTTTALNLAFSLARQAEQRTILAEIDLRRPSIARILGLTRQQSFASVLGGTADFAQHALRYGSNLAVATNHTAVRNPAELLHGATVGAALAQIEEKYAPTMMIFDMPPMLVSDDTMAFMRHVDCVLILAAAESTTIAEVDVCERDLAAQTNVLGVVLNKCRFPDRRYGYSQYS